MQSPSACNEFDSSVVLRLIHSQTGRSPAGNSFLTLGTETTQAIENDVSNCHGFVSSASSFLSAVQKVAFFLAAEKQRQCVWSHLVVWKCCWKRHLNQPPVRFLLISVWNSSPTQGAVIDSRGTLTTLTECPGDPFFYGPYTCRPEQ